MSSWLLNVTYDCVDASAAARFWSGVTGWPLRQEQTSSDNVYWVVGDEHVAVPRLVFVGVPEEKVVKNRVHVDVVPDGVSQDEEVARLAALGARILDDRREAGGGWVVMADPEGNEFCVEPNA